MKVKLCLIKSCKMQDIRLFQKHSFWPINEDLIASFEILNYYKYLFDAQGFYRKSPKSELTIEIENNYKCGANTRKRGIRFTKFLNFHC